MDCRSLHKKTIWNKLEHFKNLTLIDENDEIITITVLR